MWANFPYLHNGSVPTLHHLLGPASERPAIFEVMAARTLDRVRVGQPLFVDPADARLGEAELVRRFGDDRNWFNTARPGSRQRRPRLLVADPHGREPARADRIPQDVMSAGVR